MLSDSCAVKQHPCPRCGGTCLDKPTANLPCVLSLRRYTRYTGRNQGGRGCLGSPTLIGHNAGATRPMIGALTNDAKGGYYALCSNLLTMQLRLGAQG